MLSAHSFYKPLGRVDLAILLLCPVAVAHFFYIQWQHLMCPIFNQCPRYYVVRVMNLLILILTAKTRWALYLFRMKIFASIKSKGVIALSIHSGDKPIGAAYPTHLLEQLCQQCPDWLDWNSIYYLSHLRV